MFRDACLKWNTEKMRGDGTVAIRHLFPKDELSPIAG